MKLTLLSFLGILLLTGCFALPVEEAVLPPPAVQVPEIRTMRTIEVVRGDVVSSIQPSTTYLPVRQEDLFFSVAGRRIRGIYVNIGDEVEAGDLLAELDRPYLFDQLEDTRRDEEWVQLHLTQLNERHQFALAQAAENEIPVDDFWYLQERTRLNGELQIIRRRMAHIQSEIEEMQIRAPFDGVVSHAMNFAGVMWSQIGQTIITVSDRGQYVFRLASIDATLFEIGQIYDKTIMGQTFEAEVIDPDEEGIERPLQLGVPMPEAYFRIIGDVMPDISGTNFGSVLFIHAQATDVILLPSNVINNIDGRIFVHILEDDVVVMRDIEIGLVGNFFTEIIDGLDEGDMVVIL